MAPEEQHLYDEVLGRQDAMWEVPPVDYFGALLHSPPLGALVNKFSQFIRTASVRGAYSDAFREWVDMVMAIDLDHNVVFQTHIADAVAVGVRPEAIDALHRGDEAELTDTERQLAEYVRAVVDGRVTDEMFEGMTDLLGLRSCIEYTGFICYLLFTFRMMSALGCALPEIPREELIRPYLDGTAALPDPKLHVG